MVGVAVGSAVGEAVIVDVAVGTAVRLAVGAGVSLGTGVAVFKRPCPQAARANRANPRQRKLQYRWIVFIGSSLVVQKTICLAAPDYRVTRLRLYANNDVVRQGRYDGSSCSCRTVRRLIKEPKPGGGRWSLVNKWMPNPGCPSRKVDRSEYMR